MMGDASKIIPSRYSERSGHASMGLGLLACLNLAESVEYMIS